MAKWDTMKAKFVQEYKKLNTYTPSGSGRESTNQWKWFDALQFLCPYVQHAPMVSSIHDPQSIKRKDLLNDEKEKFKKQKTTNNSSNGDELLLLRSQFVKSLDKNGDKNYPSDNYMPVIKEGMKVVREDLKFQCTGEILNCIKSFKNNEK